MPGAQRTRSNSEVADDLRALVEGQAPGMVVRTTAPQGQFLLERVLGQQKGLQVGVRGYDIDTLGSLAQLAADVVRSVDGVTDVKLSQEAGVPQQEVRVDRARAADVGLSVRAVSDVLQAAFAGCKAGEFRAGGSSDRILMQLAGAEKRLLDEVLDPTLTNPRGERIALRNLVTTQASRGLLGVGRKNRQRLVTVQAGVTGRDLGSVAHEVQASLDRLPRRAGSSIDGAGALAAGTRHRRGRRRVGADGAHRGGRAARLDADHPGADPRCLPLVPSQAAWGGRSAQRLGRGRIVPRQLGTGSFLA